MPKSSPKTPLYVSALLLGCALVLLSGCSWENTPAAVEKTTPQLAVDKLPTDETTKKPDAPAAKTPTPDQSKSNSNSMTKKQYPSAPEMSLVAGKQYSVTLKTSKGNIVIQLAADKTPKTVNNFVFLAKEHFYDGTVFHRTLPGFMIQGGDPTGTGMGGPGYDFADEPFGGEYMRGTVAMANRGPNTNGSQFFIMHADYPLPKNYVIFGQVTEGMEVVDAIATAPATSNGMGENSKPVEPVIISEAVVQEK